MTHIQEVTLNGRRDYRHPHSSYNACVGTFDLIVSDPNIFGGKPCIRGTRISVEFILELMASGANIDEIAAQYPHVPPEGIEQALRYAAASMKNEAVLTTEVAV